MIKKRKLLQVKVIACFNVKAWYSGKLGRTFFVFDHGPLADMYGLVGSTEGHRVYNKDCEIINDFGYVDPNVGYVNDLNEMSDGEDKAKEPIPEKYMFGNDVVGRKLTEVMSGLEKISQAEQKDNNLEKKMHGDPVDHPEQYTSHPSGVEVIQITEHMNFCLGNAVKYILRCDFKGKPIQDLKKAIWYIKREIERRTKDET